MKEYKATLHGYQIVTPKRCKLERLEPVTEEIVLPLHYAESAPVAMRVNGPLEYTGKDGNIYTWRSEGLELLALDGMLWRVEERAQWNGDEWTPAALARLCAPNRVLDEWPYTWGNDKPTTHLLRDRGRWATIENLTAETVEKCDSYAVIGGMLCHPARELVYTYDRYTPWRRSCENGRRGSVIEAREYRPSDNRHYLCNALQDWREVNVYDEYTDRIQDKILNEVTGADVIEVLMPEYVRADPYADFWREEIRRHEEKAENCKQAAKEHAEKARALREDAKKDREAAKREKDAAREIAEKLNAYLTTKEA